MAQEDPSRPKYTQEDQTVTVTRQYRDSTETITPQYRYITETVLRQYRVSIATVPRQYRDSTVTVLQQYRDSTETVLRQYRDSTVTVPQAPYSGPLQLPPTVAPDSGPLSQLGLSAEGAMANVAYMREI